METLPRVALPPKVRAIVYLVFGILGVVVGCTQIAYLAAHLVQPVWLTVAVAVFPVLTAGFGYTAASNTPTPEVPLLTPGPSVVDESDGTVG